MESIIITAYTNDEKQIDALKAFMKALKIKFEIKKEDNPYNPEFVEKIEESLNQAKEGKVMRIKKENLKTFLDL